MHCDHHDRSKVFPRMKQSRGESNSTSTTLLHTPVGTYHGEDVLEGFAADAEHLGKSNEGSSTFDQSFYNVCKIDNLYIS